MMSKNRKRNLNHVPNIVSMLMYDMLFIRLEYITLECSETHLKVMFRNNEFESHVLVRNKNVFLGLK